MEEIYFRIERSRKLIPFRNIHQRGDGVYKKFHDNIDHGIDTEQVIEFGRKKGWDCTELLQKITLAMRC